MPQYSEVCWMLRRCSTEGTGHLSPLCSVGETKTLSRTGLPNQPTKITGWRIFNEANAGEFHFQVHLCVKSFQTYRSLHFGLLSWSRRSHWERRWRGWKGGCTRTDPPGRCDWSQSQRETTEPCQTETEFAEEQGVKERNEFYCWGTAQQTHFLAVQRLNKLCGCKQARYSCLSRISFLSKPTCCCIRNTTDYKPALRALLLINSHVLSIRAIWKNMISFTCYKD